MNPVQNIQDTWGNKVIERALEYANHEWYASVNNVYHGFDSNNTIVDTPDVTWKGKELSCGWWEVEKLNIGIPYSWGCASTINEFNKGILEGRYAGNVPEDKTRLSSKECVGVDCSGLLSICWNLPKRISTNEIPNVARTINKINDIRPGDILAKIGSHVMLFVEFSNEDSNLIKIIDSTRSTGKVSIREIYYDDLERNGYLIYRKNNNAL